MNDESISALDYITLLRLSVAISDQKVRSLASSLASLLFGKIHFDQCDLVIIRSLVQRAIHSNYADVPKFGYGVVRDFGANLDFALPHVLNELKGGPNKHFAIRALVGFWKSLPELVGPYISELAQCEDASVRLTVYGSLAPIAAFEPAQQILKDGLNDSQSYNRLCVAEALIKVSQHSELCSRIITTIVEQLSSSVLPQDRTERDYALQTREYARYLFETYVQPKPSLIVDTI